LIHKAISCYFIRTQTSPARFVCASFTTERFSSGISVASPLRQIP
jgi:hypothetical protein